MRWLSRDGALEDHWLRDDLPREKAAECLRTALDPSSSYIAEVIRAADRRLTEVRAAGH